MIDTLDMCEQRSVFAGQYVAYQWDREYGASDEPSQPVLQNPSTVESFANFGTFVYDRSEYLLRQFHTKIAADLKEIESEGGATPTTGVQQKAEQLARQLVQESKVVLAPQLGWGSFVNDERKVCIVLQSVITDRRLTLRVVPEDASVEVRKLDEAMNSEDSTFELHDLQSLRSLATWVTTRT